MYLGIDLGTSAIKALLMRAEGDVVATASAPLTVQNPQPGWSEQDPDDWIRGCEAAVAQLQRTHPDAFAAVSGIGLSGQMHGATVLDATDNPLRPAILWNDTRSHVEAAALDADPRFRVVTGNIVFPGFTAPKLVWLATHEPDVYRQVRKVLLPKDYVRLWLTGEHASDLSDASGTSWLDVSRRQWSADLLAATHLDVSHMPRLVEGTERSGQLRSELAHAWGLDGSIPVAGGAGDNAAAAVALGIVADDMAFVSLGTSGVLFVANNGFRPNPEHAVHAFCHALPGHWHQMGVILSATDSLSWLSMLTGVSPQDLTAELGPPLQPPTGALVLPYFSGERTPHNDARIRGAMLGLDRSMDRSALTRATLEGVAFALKDCLRALEATGVRISRVTITGGGAASSYWQSTLATVLDVTIDVPADGGFGAGLGAARLAQIAAEGCPPSAVCVTPEILHSVAPDEALKGAFEEAYERFRAAYLRLRD
ncbi:MAG: xylulokinase [Pseudomonadota bacterium]